MTPRHSLAMLVLIPALSAACAWPSPERQLLIDFFQACRVYDRAVLARLATVPCNPRTDGVIQDFDIVSVGQERAANDASEGRDVTIRARVRSFDGPTVQQVMTLSLERRDGRWLVAGIIRPPASQTSPAASSGRPR